MDLGQALITEHAAGRMSRRQIAESDVRTVLAQPEELLDVRRGRVVHTSKIDKSRSRP